MAKTESEITYTRTQRRASIAAKFNDVMFGGFAAEHAKPGTMTIHNPLKKHRDAHDIHRLADLAAISRVARCRSLPI